MWKGLPANQCVIRQVLESKDMRAATAGRVIRIRNLRVAEWQERPVLPACLLTHRLQYHLTILDYIAVSSKRESLTKGSNQHP